MSRATRLAFVLAALGPIWAAPGAQAARSRGKLALHVPAVGSIEITPARRVTTQSQPFLGLPAAQADVHSSGRVHLTTGSRPGIPSTATRIDRPFEIFSSIGNATWRITPFRIQRIR